MSGTTTRSNLKYSTRPATSTTPNTIQRRARRSGMASGSVVVSALPKIRERRNGPNVGRWRAAFFLHEARKKTRTDARAIRATFPRKLSLRQTLRHRLPAMSYLRFQDEDESSVSGTVTSVLLGAVAGFAVGMLVAQRVGGFSGLTSLAKRVRNRGEEELTAGGPVVADDFSDYEDDFEDDDLLESGEGSDLEERVLEAFRNDPILSERAIDIGGIGE